MARFHKDAFLILDLHVGHVGGEVQKNILSILLWASAVVGELHCLVIPEVWLQVKNNHMVKIMRILTMAHNLHYCLVDL